VENKRRIEIYPTVCELVFWNDMMFSVTSVLICTTTVRGGGCIVDQSAMVRV
jgi:hypothetical protein